MVDPSAGRTFVAGTHNTLDGKAPATPFADVLVFTEAIPWRVFWALSRRNNFGVVVCKQQRDLVVAFRRSVFRRDGDTSYEKYVDGWAEVSPNRGTFTVPLLHRDTGVPIPVNAEHRINAAFHPFIRGEASFREAAWQRHTAGTLATMRDQAKDKRVVVVSMGDVNTPRGEHGYPGFNEVGHHFDRIASTAKLTKPEIMRPLGSDHHRIRATVHIPL